MRIADHSLQTLHVILGVMGWRRGWGGAKGSHPHRPPNRNGVDHSKDGKLAHPQVSLVGERGV